MDSSVRRPVDSSILKKERHETVVVSELSQSRPHSPAHSQQQSQEPAGVVDGRNPQLDPAPDTRTELMSFMHSLEQEKQRLQTAHRQEVQHQRAHYEAQLSSVRAERDTKAHLLSAAAADVVSMQMALQQLRTSSNERVLAADSKCCAIKQQLEELQLQLTQAQQSSRKLTEELESVRTNKKVSDWQAG